MPPDYGVLDRNHCRDGLLARASKPGWIQYAEAKRTCRWPQHHWHRGHDNISPDCRPTWPPSLFDGRVRGAVPGQPDRKSRYSNDISGMKPDLAAGCHSLRGLPPETINIRKYCSSCGYDVVLVQPCICQYVGHGCLPYPNRNLPKRLKSARQRFWYYRMGHRSWYDGARQPNHVRLNQGTSTDSESLTGAPGIA